MKIALEIEITEEFMSNVMITAFDGTHGGCWYWAAPASLPNGMSFVIESGPKTSDDIWKKVSIVDKEEERDESAEVWAVDHHRLLAGIEKILNGTVQINDGIRDSIRRAVMDDDAGDVDADGADCIVQAGIFGELVYG